MMETLASRNFEQALGFLTADSNLLIAIAAASLAFIVLAGRGSEYEGTSHPGGHHGHDGGADGGDGGGGDGGE